MRLLGFTESLTQDLRYAIRGLSKSTGFTVVVVATLALAIGGVTAVVSVFNAVLLSPLPYEASEQLVRFYQDVPETGGQERNFVSGAHFREIRDGVESFAAVAAIANYSETGRDLVLDGRSERIRVLGVTSGYFGTLRSGALYGREFGRDDEDGRNLVVLSDRLWQSRFGSDPSILGRTVYLSAEPYVVIGVAPAGLEDPIEGHIEAWLPYNLIADTYEENYNLSVVGRLRDETSLPAARAELASLSRDLAQRWPNVAFSELVAEPLRDDLVAASRGTINLLSLAVVLVLIVACANVAGLNLIRASARRHEFAIRSAVGAGGSRITSQLLVESFLLASAGGLAGLMLGTLALQALFLLGQDAIPRLDEIDLDTTVLLGTASVTLAAGLAFGLLPALRFARTQPGRALQQRASTVTRSQDRLRGGLAAAQLALALTLLVGAGGLLASFLGLQRTDLGFRSDGVLTFSVNLPSARYDAARRADFQEALARRIETIQAVSSAGGTSRLPATGSYHPWGTRPMTGPRAAEAEPAISVQQRVVSGRLFAALGIPILAGRVFDARDDAESSPKAVISESLARRFFPGMSLDAVVGQRTRVFLREEEIVGVVGDVALDSYGARAPSIYRPHRQFADDRNWALTQVVATELPFDQALAAVRAEVAALDSELVVHRTASMADVVGGGIARERFALALVGAFALVALLLSAIGLYGVLAYSVRQRTREIGIRMVLGATAGGVRNLVLRQASVVVAWGVGFGVLGALSVGRWLSSLLHGVSPSEPRVVLSTTLVLVGVALAAAWIPSRRASGVEPRIAMHDD